MSEGVPQQERVLVKARNEEMEIQLFGEPLAEGSPLLKLYEYFSSEEMSEIAIQLDFNWGDFHGIANASQLDPLMPEIQALAEYKAKREALGQYITPQESMALNREYALFAKDLSRKL